MMKLGVFSTLAVLASFAGVTALDADAAQKERSLFWDSYIENVDSFPSAAPSPEPSPEPSPQPSRKFLCCVIFLSTICCLCHLPQSSRPVSCTNVRPVRKSNPYNSQSDSRNSHSYR